MNGELRQVETPLGTLTYTLTTKKVKNLNLRLKEDGTVWLSAAGCISRRAADAFVKSRAPWIFAHRDRLKERAVVLTPPNREQAARAVEASVERMWPLVQPLGVTRPQVRTRFMTSRWGSCCCGRGIITLNTALLLVPGELMDYVVLHELVHFLHPDHGKGFYAAMSGLMPDWQERRRRLRGYILRKEPEAPAPAAK